MNTPVKYSLAKLLKEKGFEQNIEAGVICRVQNSINKHYEETRPLNDSDLQNEWAILNEVYPKIAEVVMWLYEKHDVWISPIPDSSSGHRLIMRKMSVHLFKYKNGLNVQTETLRNIDKDIIYFLSPTEAYEAAIEYTLNNLI